MGCPGSAEHPVQLMMLHENKQNVEIEKPRRRRSRRGGRGTRLLYSSSTAVVVSLSRSPGRQTTRKHTHTHAHHKQQDHCMQQKKVGQVVGTGGSSKQPNGSWSIGTRRRRRRAGGATHPPWMALIGKGRGGGAVVEKPR